MSVVTCPGAVTVVASAAEVIVTVEAEQVPGGAGAGEALVTMVVREGGPLQLPKSF